MMYFAMPIFMVSLAAITFPDYEWILVVATVCFQWLNLKNRLNELAEQVKILKSNGCDRHEPLTERLAKCEQKISNLERQEK